MRAMGVWLAALVVTLAAGCASVEPGGPAASGAGGPDLSELAKKSQNPMADMISLPLQNNTSFGIGPHDRIANVLNVQPVVPVNIGEWLLINRLIVPVAYAPYPQSRSDSEFGLGDVTYTAFFSPPSDGMIWGVGPVLGLPTATEDLLGSGKWSAGPSVVALATPGPWVVGGLANHLWSYAGDSDRDSVSQTLIQPFVNYNLSDGWSISSSPILTANWKADAGDRWLVPLGGGFGKVFRIGRQPMSFNAQAFWHAVKPDGGPDWSLRIQINFLFPK